MIRHRLLTTDDVEGWRDALPAEACVMGCVELARVTERWTGSAARLLVVELGGHARIVYPFFLRAVGAPSLVAGLPEGLHDTCTPEYTGPLRIGRSPAEPGEAVREAALFNEALASRFAENGVVAEFAHLSPWRAELNLLVPSGVEVDREIVWIDLEAGEEGIWAKSFSSDARRMVRQAQRAEVQVRRACTREDILEFHRLYVGTMSRREASARYWFSPEYFLDIFESMPENAVFLLAEHRGRPVAGGLAFHDATDVYWHLSAADLEYARVRPVNAYVHELLGWAVRAGKRRFLCGGGAQAPDDGVFRFKASLSPLRAQFRVYKRIHAPDRYAALVRATWGTPVASLQTHYFPAYRAGQEQRTKSHCVNRLSS